VDGPTDLTVLIVSWNGREVLQRCLESVIAEAGEVQTKIIVVDNASDDDSVAMVRREFPHVTVIENDENLGFARAVNQGLRLSAGRDVLLLNPDAVVMDRALEYMVCFLDSHPSVGAVAPRVVQWDGQVDHLHSPKRFPTWKDDLREALRRRPRHCTEPAIADRSWVEDGQAVDVVPGTCMMVKRQAIEEVGELDERFFLFSEDVDWCFRFQQAGWEVRWWPGATVMHGHIERSAMEWPRVSLEGIVSRDKLYRKYRGEAYAWRYRILVGTAALMKVAAWVMLSFLRGETVWRRNCKIHLDHHVRVARWVLRGR